MPLQIIKTVRVLRLDHTAADWHLSSDRPGSSTAAAKLNAEFTGLVNMGYDRETVSKIMAPMFKKYAVLGAQEPAVVREFKALLKEVFGK